MRVVQIHATNVGDLDTQLVDPLAQLLCLGGRETRIARRCKMVHSYWYHGIVMGREYRVTMAGSFEDFQKSV